jgi:hypothetical protein
VEQRVNVWKAVLVPESENHSFPSSLQHISYWIREARTGHDRGVPSGSFSLVLHGPTPDADQNIGETLVQAAGWQDANLEFVKRTESEKLTRNHPICEDYLDLIREIPQRKTPVRFDYKYSDELWDAATILEDQVRQWPRTYREAIKEDAFLEPGRGRKREGTHLGPN